MIAVRSVGAIVELLIVAASSAQAAQPLVTDDAAVVAPKTCQLEAWARSTHDSHEYWAQPACNFGGDLELSVGVAGVHSDAGESSSNALLQVKTVPFPRDGGTWSFGVVAGAARDTGASHGSSAFQVYYAKALASWYPRNDVEIDFNLGAANVYASGTFAIGGAAVQYAAVANLQLLAEAFRDEPGRGKYQVGVRWIVIPDRLETYASYGNRFNGSSDQWSAIIGIRVQTAPFLP
jgi:hypothetical protein